MPEEEINLDIEKIKKYKPIIKVAALVIMIGLIAFLLFVFGAYYTCSKSEGFLKHDLSCVVNTSSLPYCRSPSQLGR